MTTIKESPRRIQRKRTKGWRMPDDTVYVGRGSKWGNPWRVQGSFTASMAVGAFKQALERGGYWDNPDHENWTGLPATEVIRRDLAGKNLACWCPPAQPCHSEVLLEIANTEDWMTVGQEVWYWPGVRSELYQPKNGTIIAKGVAIFGGTACVRIRTQQGGSDYIQLSHIEAAS